MMKTCEQATPNSSRIWLHFWWWRLPLQSM